MTLNAVVLPAPFGPMRPATEPRETSNETPSRATMPPNRSVTSRTERSITAPILRGVSARGLRQTGRAEHREADRSGEEDRAHGDEHRRHLAGAVLSADAGAEPGVYLPERVRALCVERLGARVLGDRRERIAVGRHGDDLLLAGRAGEDRAAVRAERDGEDGDACRVRALRALPGAQEAARLGAVREEEDRRERASLLVARGLLRRRPVHLARLAGGGAREVDGAREPVADRGAEPRPEEVDSLVEQLPVDGRRDDDRRLVGEGHDPDAKGVGGAVEERPHR